MLPGAGSSVLFQQIQNAFLLLLLGLLEDLVLVVEQVSNHIDDFIEILDIDHVIEDSGQRSDDFVVLQDRLLELLRYLRRCFFRDARLERIDFGGEGSPLGLHQVC